MALPLTVDRLRHENLAFTGTAGVSSGNGRARFVPAFRDDATGQVERARFADGSPAPLHVMDGLPASWVSGRDADGCPCALKPGIVSGFLRDGRFYTRDEVASMLA
jgi:hypothetical protein